MSNKENKKIGWKLASASFDMASVRYRGLFPAVALQELGVETRVFFTPIEENLKD
jgi:hypothetical protein